MVRFANCVVIFFLCDRDSDSDLFRIVGYRGSFTDLTDCGTPTPRVSAVADAWDVSTFGRALASDVVN
jgi:hypothetical protein